MKIEITDESGKWLARREIDGEITEREYDDHYAAVARLSIWIFDYTKMMREEAGSGE